MTPEPQSVTSCSPPSSHKPPTFQGGATDTAFHGRIVKEFASIFETHRKEKIFKEGRGERLIEEVLLTREVRKKVLGMRKSGKKKK